MKDFKRLSTQELLKVKGGDDGDGEKDNNGGAISVPVYFHDSQR